MKIEPLTKRELEVLKLMHKVKNRQELADLLCITIATLNVHLKSIKDKLYLSCATSSPIAYIELYKKAIQAGLITIEEFLEDEE